MAKDIVDTVLNSHDAGGLGKDLTRSAADYAGHVIYVKLPDGSVVYGYDVEEETLTDGSKVYLILKAA